MAMKQNFPLLIGLAIPVLMVLVVVAFIVLPGIFVKPTVHFLYATDLSSFGEGGPYRDLSPTPGSGTYDRETYVVRDGRLTRAVQTLPIEERIQYLPSSSNVQFYVHDVQTNRSREVSVEDAQKLTLDDSARSPDGFELTRGSGGGGAIVFPFFFLDGDRGESSDWYLRGRGARHHVNLRGITRARDYYRDRLYFIAWIITPTTPQ